MPLGIAFSERSRLACSEPGVRPVRGRDAPGEPRFFSVERQNGRYRGTAIKPRTRGAQLMKSHRWAFLLLVPALLAGCGPTPDQAVGENTQLKSRLNSAEATAASLKQDNDKLQAENDRLREKLAAATGGKGLSIEEAQKHLDVRQANLEKREQDLLLHEKTAENQLDQRRQAQDTELGTREKAVQKRELEISQKEGEFYKATNLTMKDIGEAQQIKREYEGMRTERDRANAKADRWLVFIWIVSIAFIIAIMGLSATLMILRHRSLIAVRELDARQEMARLLGAAIASQLPPEHGAMVVDAFNRLTATKERRANAADIHRVGESPPS